MHQLKATRSNCRDSGHEMTMPQVPQASHHRPNSLSNSLYTTRDARFTSAPQDKFARDAHVISRSTSQPLYTAEEKRRRDATAWTTVQAILAPVQFVAFLISLALVVRYLTTGEGLWIATASIVIKTLLLYAIMITGSIWERVVFGRYLFAPAFYWEDVFSMLVLALHTAYLAAIFFDIGTVHQQMILVLAAYASYAINATQFLLKLRAARLQDRDLRTLPHLVSEGAQ